MFGVQRLSRKLDRGDSSSIADSSSIYVQERIRIKLVQFPFFRRYVEFWSIINNLLYDSCWRRVIVLNIYLTSGTVLSGWIFTVTRSAWPWTFLLFAPNRDSMLIHDPLIFNILTHCFCIFVSTSYRLVRGQNVSVSLHIGRFGKHLVWESFQFKSKGLWDDFISFLTRPLT